MKENNYFEVFWKQVNPSTFMYGSKLAFKDGVTVFENPLMPSRYYYSRLGYEDKIMLWIKNCRPYLF
ncbi:accessory Sec system asp3 [Staphylococcus gallinarum]|uniref:Accessory Sec system asp3 n=1 Tax=Staphylococcus gallinarum TaxID=1293 RepID=A0A380FBK1_STAGA|nr:accessory Sec system asp3 [Staphylococcus gallinarum]